MTALKKQEKPVEIVRAQSRRTDAMLNVKNGLLVYCLQNQKIKSSAAKETAENNNSNPNARNPIYNIFCDAVPNPPLGLLHQNCHALSHAKVLIEIADDISILYVGSHNFSKAAWGLHSTSPKNVEVGVVLATKSVQVREEWVSRLPYYLPDRSATSPDTYIPATGRGDIRSAYECGNPNADRMFRSYLSSSED